MSENTAVVTKKEPGMASLVIVLFAISAITALVLGLVNMVTAPQIAINTQKKTDEANVKVRDGLLDIKVKTGQTPEGYEIFQPRGKFQFPVKRDELLEILSFLKVDLTIEAEEISFDEFKRLAADCPDLAFVTVEKKRYGFSVNGVICEYAYVWLNGAQIESACCESEDYGAMRAAVEALGIAEMPNVNYLKAIKRVIGFGQ